MTSSISQRLFTSAPTRVWGPDPEGRLRIFEFAPAGERRWWGYLTDGMHGAVGGELLLCAPDKGLWAPKVLRRLCALVRERFGSDEDFFARLWELEWPVGGGITSALRAIFFVPAERAGVAAAEPEADVLVVLGLTHDERLFGQRFGRSVLLELLKTAGGAPVTNPARTSLLQEEALEETIQRLIESTTASPEPVVEPAPPEVVAEQAQLRLQETARGLLERSRLQSDPELFERIVAQLGGLPPGIKAIGIEVDEDGRVLLELAPVMAHRRPWWRFW